MILCFFLAFFSRKMAVRTLIITTANLQNFGKFKNQSVCPEKVSDGLGGMGGRTKPTANK